MADKIHFGPGCSTIEVDPFEPICDMPEPQGSEPSTFHVPLPAAVPPVPPSECICFDFKSEEVDPIRVGKYQVAKCEVRIEPQGDCCDGVYKITPIIELPYCTLDDASLNGTFATDGNGSTVQWKLTRKDCGLALEFTPTIVPMPPIPAPCFRVEGDGGVYPTTAAVKGRKARPVRMMTTTQQPFAIRAKYKNASGDDAYTDPANFTITEDDSSGCDYFKVGSATLDLTGIGGSFENGGDVNLRPSDKKLVIDGSEWTGDHTWYGGGYGNVSQDTEESLGSIRDRGPGMRNQYTPAGFENISIPAVSLHDNYQQRLLMDDRATTKTVWLSGRYNKETKVFTPGSGNLDICLPSGFEWHMPEVTNGPIRGVTVTFSDFIFNSSGVLSTEGEAEGGVIVAPGLAVTKAAAESSIPAGLNASGLMTVDDGSVGQTGHGLRVNAGDGLRIYGIGDGSTDSTDTDTDGSRQGVLEVMYGPGFKIKDGESTFLNKPVDRSGALSLNVGVGVHVKGQSGAPTLAQRADNQLEVTTVGYELAYSPNGNLIISDFQMPASDYMGWDGVVDWTRRNETAYGSELIIPILMPASVNDIDLSSSTSFDYYTPSSSVRMKVGYLRIANSGITIGAATKQGWNTYPRIVQVIPT